MCDQSINKGIFVEFGFDFEFDRSSLLFSEVEKMTGEIW